MRQIPGIQSLKEACPQNWDSERNVFFYQSAILRYGVIDVADSSDPPDLIEHIKDHCAAASRLRAVAITAYENLACGPWTVRITVPAWIFITSAISCIDALACIMRAVTTGEVPPSENSLTSIGRLRGEAERTNLAIFDKLRDLEKSEWLSELMSARHEIVHRGYWLCPQHEKGFTLVRGGGVFAMGRQKLESYSAERTIDLFKMAKGLLAELEAWEIDLAPLLDSAQQVQPLSSRVNAYFPPKWERIGDGEGGYQY